MPKNIYNAFLFCLIFYVAILGMAMPSCCRAGGLPDSESVTGVTWKWLQTQYNNDQVSLPAQASRYSIIFYPRGVFNIQVDCNRGGGRYSLQDRRVTIEVTHTTQAMCSPDSLSQRFIKNLNSARIYFMKENDLYLDLKYDTGTMRFGR